MSSAPREVKILVACGTAIATATVVAGKIKEAFDKLKIPVKIVQCKAAEVTGKIEVFEPDVIVANTPISEKAAKGIPVINGVPFLTGMGEKEALKKIFEAVGIEVKDL